MCRSEQLFAAILAVVVLGACSRASPEFKVGQTITLTIVREGPPGEAPVEEQVTTDRVKIASLLAVLRGASPAKDHKCSDSRLVFLDQRDGRRVQIGTLAGHDSRYYEFRLYRGSDYDIYRVERQPFLDAMAGLGVTEIDLGGPE
jgi:hypothetical protein